MRQRHAERQADLRAGAERLARMAIWLVKIPQLVSPILERVRGQDPILILDHVPKLASESRQRDRHAFPVLTRLSGPCGEQSIVFLRKRFGALCDARGQFRLPADALAAQLRELRDRGQRVAEYAQAA